MSVKGILQGRWMGHPLHPAIVHLPIGLWVGSLISDLFALGTANPGFAAASFWLITIGTIAALIAASAGLAEYVDIPRHTTPKQIATLHLGLNISMVALYVLSWAIRLGEVASSVPARSFVLNVIAVALCWLAATWEVAWSTATGTACTVSSQG